MNKTLFRFLNEIGCPCHLKGRRYIEMAIGMMFENQDILIAKELYPRIAENKKATPQSVERAIRHAVKVCVEKGNKQMIKSVFGDSIHLSNGAFLFGILRRLETFSENE